MSLSFPPTVHFALGRSTARTSSACTASRFAVPQFQPGAGPKSSAQSWTWQVGQLRQMLSILETTSLTFLNPKLYFFLISFVLQEVVNAGSPCRSLTWSSALVAVIDVENKKHTWTQAAVAWDVHAPRFQGWCSCCQQGPQTLVSIWLQRVHVAPPQKDRRSDFFASNLDCGHHLMSDCFLFTCPFI